MDWKAAEDLVASKLKERGHLIVFRNFRIGCDEIDIVTQKDGKLFAFEVRLRAGFNNIFLWEYLSYSKYYRLLRSTAKLSKFFKLKVHLRVALVRYSRGKRHINMIKPRRIFSSSE